MPKCEECAKFYADEEDESKGVCLFQKRESTVGPLYWDTKEVKAGAEACGKFEARLPLLEQIYQAEVVPEKREATRPF